MRKQIEEQKIINKQENVEMVNFNARLREESVEESVNDLFPNLSREGKGKMVKRVEEYRNLFENF